MNELVDVEKTIKDKTDNLVTSIIEEDNIEETKKLLNLFNVNIAKKNALRVAKVDALLDKANDEAIERISNHADYINDKDLISYINVAQNQITNSMNIINKVNETPAIQLNQDNSVNINVTTELSKESRDRVLNVVQQILNSNQNNVVDVDVTEKK